MTIAPDAVLKHCARLGHVKVRAIAIASQRSNLIGAVDLTTSAEGLALTYVDAAHVGPDTVPVAFERNAERLVPWEQVIDARLLGNTLYLELTAGHGVIQRLLLVHFSFGEEQTPRELKQRRLLLRAFIISLGLMAIVIAAISGPRLNPSSGIWFGLGLGLFLAMVIAIVGVVSDNFLVHGGHSSTLVREIFVGELLATLPRLPREPGKQHERPRTFRLPPLDGILPRTTAAIVITLSGAVLAAVVMANWVFFGDHTNATTGAPRRTVANQEERPSSPLPVQAATVTVPASAKSAPPPSIAPPAAAGGLSATGPCTCPRADSPLWREPLPQLTPLVLATRRFPHKNHEDVELELAVVNNGERPLGNISVLVEFFEADQGNVTRLTSVESRTVFFEGPLMPGKAIKWHVEERGTTFKIHPPTSNGLIVDQAIGPLGEGAASATSFAELLSANNRPVRLHGAMMLAYLGDKRARPGVVDLGEALRDSEGAYLRRVLEATSDQIACQITLGKGNPAPLRACIYNQATTPAENPVVSLRLLDSIVSSKDPVGPAPQILGERNLTLAVKLEPATGVLVDGTVDLTDLGGKPVSYEIVVAPAPK